MWPTFYIPTRFSPGERETDCWWIITKEHDTSRAPSDAYAFDDELQFPLIDGRLYRMVGFLKAYREDDNNGQRMQIDVRTSGTPEALWTRFSHTTQAIPDFDYPYPCTNEPCWPTPFDGYRTLPPGAVNNFGNRSVAMSFHTFVKASATSGTIGMHWGVTPGTPAVDKYWTLLTGSWLAIRTYDP